MSQQLQEAAEKALKKAEALGAQQVEVYIASARSFSIDVENSAIKSASEKRDAGCGIRSVVDKRIGFAYVTTILDADILETAEQSVKLAKAAIADPSFVSLPSFSGTYPAVKGIFDSRVHNLSSEDAAEVIVKGVDATKEVLEGRNSAVEAKLVASSGTKAVVNSLGIASSTKSTSVYMFTYPTIKEDNDQTSSYQVQVSRQLDGIDPEWIGRTSAENAL
ncbi:MAG: PmbA/TldA family metallopeptidase, partial [Candidatus Hodarchaeota archaeon]